LGCDGLELTDEVRVIIVAYACLVLLALLNDYYCNVGCIYVYPMTILSLEFSIGLFEVRTTPVNCPMPSIGEAHHRVPVILVWDVVNIENRHLEQVHNVVYHEFSHKLDMLDGSAEDTSISPRTLSGFTRFLSGRSDTESIFQLRFLP
jgi:MtfA peptidase